MAKYVDIDVAKEAVRRAECDANWDGHRFDVECIESALDFIPAADVVPVVRCKDCKHKGWIQEPCHGETVDFCNVWVACINNPDKCFCCYGEAKMDGETEGK